MSADTPTPVDLLVPVIDGDDPAGWEIWGARLDEHVADFYKTARSVPTDFKALGVGLKILPHEEQKLHGREASEWKNVVGILIDSNGDRETRERTADRVIRVCAALAAANDAWYRKLRFHLGLLLAEEPPAAEEQTYVDFAHQLKLRVESVLAGEVQWQLAGDAKTFRLMLKMFEQQLVYVYLRHRAK